MIERTRLHTGRLTRALSGAGLALALIAAPGLASAQTVVYDMLANGPGSGGNGFFNIQQVGQHVTLDGTERAVVEFEIYLRAAVSVATDSNFRVRFYEDDGGATPGPVLWTSGNIAAPNIGPTPQSFVIPVPAVAIAGDTFIWAVEELGPGPLVVSFASPGTTIGTAGAIWILRDNEQWQEELFSTLFACRIKAVPVSDPIAKALAYLGALLGGVEGLADFVITAPNDRAQAGRRTAMANRVLEATDAVLDDDFQGAIELLESLLVKIDGVTPPPDWLVDGSERGALAAQVEEILVALEALL
jgi:hypothetical protein